MSTTSSVKRATRLTTAENRGRNSSYLAGSTIYQPAREFGIDRRTVSEHLKRQEVSMQLQSPGAEAVDEMVRLYEAGLSLALVGERVGMSVRTVQRCLRRRGVVLRVAHGREWV